MWASLLAIATTATVFFLTAQQLFNPWASGMIFFELPLDDRACTVDQVFTQCIIAAFADH